MLCSKCQEKVNSGRVSSKYIEVAKKLLSMENKYQAIQKVRLENVIDAGGYLVLVVGKGNSTRLNTEPKIIRELGNAFNRRILVIESGVKDRKFLEDLFASQHIITINIILDSST